MENVDNNSTILANGTFDERPILLHTRGKENHGPIPFCFNLVGIQIIEERDIIHIQWGSYVNGYLGLIIETKL